MARPIGFDNNHFTDHTLLQSIGEPPTGSHKTIYNEELGHSHSSTREIQRHQFYVNQLTLNKIAAVKSLKAVHFKTVQFLFVGVSKLLMSGLKRYVLLKET